MKKRSELEVREGIQSCLERRGRFDYDYLPFGKRWREPDERFRYRRRPLGKLGTLLTRTLLRLLSPLWIRIVYGAKVVGRRNLKAVKKTGAVSICNHFSELDTLFVRGAVGHYRSFHTASPKNNKTGLRGTILRCGGLLPFSGNLAAMRNLDAEIGRLIHRRKIVNFYAEQAMWTAYRKPRPMKRGAFHYAVKFNAPVLPIFCTFALSRRGNIRRLRINVLPAVFPDADLPRSARMERMREEAQSAWKCCYERAYNEPLTYL